MTHSTSRPATLTSSPRARSAAISAVQLGVLLHWLFRISVLMEFIGHGAFGIITKAAWIPYFGVFGISEPMAYRLMPVVGIVDVSMGVLGFLSPRRALLAYMTLWGLFTAILRPLAGESVWEVLDRAGNYGVPLAFLLYSGWPRAAREWFEPIRPRPMGREALKRLALVLRGTIVLFLIGHGAYGALLHKSALTAQYAEMGLTSLPWIGGSFTQSLGWLEISLALAILVRPLRFFFLAAAGLKLMTELLYPMTGSPIWEFVERGGTYVAPLAMFAIAPHVREDVRGREE